MGGSVADALQPAVKSFNDARACVDQSKAAADKAIASAKKAIAALPKNGLAHLCLGLIALDKKTNKDSAEAMEHLQQAVEGDPQSLKGWTTLAQIYEAKGDTNKTVEALKQMLLVAPTNQTLREQAFKLFIKYERPDAAEQTALDGLKIDPTNADLYDLLSNARVFKGDFVGAVAALEQMVANDSTKADSSFYLKITVMASQKPDTAKLLKWAAEGSKKYPDNLALLNQLVAAYQLTGPVDSQVTTTKRLMEKDTTAIGPALATAQALVTREPRERCPTVPRFRDQIRRRPGEGRGVGHPVQHRASLAAAAAELARSRHQASPGRGDRESQRQDLPAGQLLPRALDPAADPAARCAGGEGKILRQGQTGGVHGGGGRSCLQAGTSGSGSESGAVPEVSRWPETAHRVDA